MVYGVMDHGLMVNGVIEHGMVYLSSNTLDN